jgi:hypothetical protein
MALSRRIGFDRHGTKLIDKKKASAYMQARRANKLELWKAAGREVISHPAAAAPYLPRQISL